MNYWFYNTDAKAFRNETGAERLLKRGFAVTGGPQKFGNLLKRLTPGDSLLMYENLVGVLAVGTVKKRWDEVAHKKQWYYGDANSHEYRIPVDWYLDFTQSPIGYRELRNAIGYTPRGAIKKDLHKHEQIEQLIAEHYGKSKVPKRRNNKPKREQCSVSRIVRDTGLARTVKRMHSFKCQICGDRITLPNGDFYAEAHHIHPLGRPHNGDDLLGNILCVCPNHHAALDHLAIRISTSKLRVVRDHKVAQKYIKHHNQRCDDAGLSR